MRLRIVLLAIIGLTICSVCLANSAPTVSNVNAVQRTDGSGIVDIWYTLSDADNDRYTIAVQVSNDGGNTWTVPATTFLNGSAIGPGVSQGRRRISWNSKNDVPGVYNTNFRVRLTEGRIE